jgi:hypothetical protein
MDVFGTDKAIDLYAAEMKRRVEELEKSVKEKEETIKKHKSRDRINDALLWVIFPAIVIGGYLIFSNVCR